MSLSQVAIGASYVVAQASALMLPLIISHLSLSTWFSFMRVKVSLYWHSTWFLRDYIFSLRAELALIRSLIMPIDSMISFVDFRVLFPALLLRYFNNFQYVLSSPFFFTSLALSAKRIFSFKSSFFDNIPVGSSASNISQLALHSYGPVFLSTFFCWHSGHSLFSNNLVRYSIWSSSLCSCCCSWWFCYFSCIFYFTLGSIFLVGRLLMQVAMLAQVRVCRDSSKWVMVGLRHAIMRQQELPPIDCLRREVSLLSLQGGSRLDFPLVLDQQREAMTCLRANRLLLIYIPSLKTTPVDLVALCLSLPAKSTIYNLLSTCSDGSSSRQLLTRKVSRQCDRLEVLFILCEPITLFFCPLRHQRSASSADLHCPSKIFSTVNCWSLFHRILRGLPSLLSMRSKMDSLQIWTKETNTRQPLSALDLSSMTLKRSLIALGTSPSVSVWSPPSMVQVLPEPVCPQAKMVE